MRHTRVLACALAVSMMSGAAQAAIVNLGFNDFEPYVPPIFDGNKHTDEVYARDGVELRSIEGLFPSHNLVNTFETRFAHDFPDCVGCNYAFNDGGVLYSFGTLELTAPGQTFSLESVSLLQGFMNYGSSVTLEAFLNGSLVNTQSVVFSTSFDESANSTWRTNLFGASLGTMDRLVLRGVSGSVFGGSGERDFWADNIQLRVPEPGTFALFAGAAGLLFLGRKVRRKNASGDAR